MPNSSSFFNAIKSIVFGCFSSFISLLKIISTLLGFKASKIILSVRCPFPVNANEPYNMILYKSAVGYFSFNNNAAFFGPIVCELDGPFPILYNSFIDFILSLLCTVSITYFIFLGYPYLFFLLFYKLC